MKYFVTDPPAFTKDIGLIPLSDDFLVNSMWGNILPAEDGYIYIAAGNHATFGGEVWLFRFDPATDRMRIQASLSDILGVRAATTAVGESKIHTRLCQGRNGRIYFGTMQGGIGHVSKLSHYWHPDQFEGGHLFEHDPATGETRDLGIPVRGEGLQTMVMDRARNVLYMVTWPKKIFLRYDLNEQRTTVYGVFGWSPTSDEGVKIHLGRELMISREGVVYCINNFGCLVRFDPDRGELEDTSVFVRENDSLRIHVRARDGTIYFATSLGYLFRFDPTCEKIEALGQVTPYESVYTPNLALSRDETKLLFLAGSHGSTTGGGLLCTAFDIASRSHHILGVLDPRFFLAYCYGVCVDENDRVIFAVHGADPPSSYLAIYDPAHPERSRWLVSEEEARNAPARKVYMGPGSEGKTRGWIATDYHVLSHESGGDIPHGQSAVTSLAAGPDGALYGATSSEPGKSAFLFRLHAPGRDVEILADLGRSLNSAQRVTKSLVGGADGNLYGGTLDLCEDLYIEKRYSRAYPPHVPKDYAGGHLFRYNVSSGEIEDLGVPVVGQGIYAMCASPDGRRVYALTFPHATLISLDVETGAFRKVAEIYGPGTPALRPDEFELAAKSFEFGRVELEARAEYLVAKRGLSIGIDELPEGLLAKKYYVSRAIVCDAEGKVYGSHGEGKLFCFDPNTGGIGLVGTTQTGKGRARQAQAAYTPLVSGAALSGNADAARVSEFPFIMGTEYGLISELSVESLVRADDGTIYGGTFQDGYLFHLDPRTGRIQGLGKPVLQGRVRDLTFWQGALHGIAGENLGKTHLFRYAPEDDGLRDLGVLQGGGRKGFAVNICDTMATGPEGRLYIGQSERISSVLSLDELRYEPFQSP